MSSPTSQVSPEVGTPTAVRRLKARGDFVRVGKGRRWHGRALTLQAAPQPEPTDTVRVGFTLTKKVGNAVIRNRARRRLKEALRLADGLQLQPSHDYVIIGRIDAIRLSFDELKRELERATRGVHRDGRAARRAPAPSGAERIRPSR